MNMTKEELKTVMGANLRRLRQANGLSLSELASQLNITDGYLGLIERGRRGFTPYMLQLSAQLFNVW